MRLNQRDDSGVATILLVLCSAFLLGAVAIAVDVGRAVAVTRSAQNSADAVALAMAKDCVERGGLSPAGYNRYIRTVPAIGNGQTPDLTAGSCAAGFVTATAHETMDYTFAKVFGMTDTTRSRPATAKWGAAERRRHLPVHVLRRVPSRTRSRRATPRRPAPLMMLYGQVNRTSCPRDGDTTGQSSNSKGFVDGGCVLTSVGGTLHDANGNSFIGTNCDSSNLDYYVGKDVLLPVWGSAAGGGGGSDYTITNLVGLPRPRLVRQRKQPGRSDDGSMQGDRRLHG